METRTIRLPDDLYQEFVVAEIDNFDRELGSGYIVSDAQGVSPLAVTREAKLRHAGCQSKRWHSLCHLMRRHSDSTGITYDFTTT